MGKRKNAKSVWRKMTPDESARCPDAISKEIKRFNESVKAGGIDGRGNYTALHHR